MWYALIQENSHRSLQELDTNLSIDVNNHMPLIKHADGGEVGAGSFGRATTLDEKTVSAVCAKGASLI